MVFKFCNFVFITKLETIQLQIFFYSQVSENIWMQELGIPSENFSNFFTFAHKPQAWKFLIWYTFWTTFDLCQITWLGACLHQCKMVFSVFQNFIFFIIHFLHSCPLLLCVFKLLMMTLLTHLASGDACVHFVSNKGRDNSHHTYHTEWTLKRLQWLKYHLSWYLI